MSRSRPVRWLGCIAAAAVVATACSGSGPSVGGPEGSTTSTAVEQSGSTTAPESTEVGAPTVPDTTADVSVPRHIDENGFDDRSVPRISSIAEYHALAATDESGRSVVKFQIPEMRGDRAVHWLDSGHYSLHDEWYFFRLLNGQPVPGSSVQPVRGLQFDTIDEIYEWARDLPDSELPLDLAWANREIVGQERLFSSNFYRLALRTDPRDLGVGALVFFPDADANSDDEGGANGEGGAGDRQHGRWLVELEFSDDPDAAELEVFFEALAATLPPEIGERLEWVLRSPQQNARAAELLEDGHPLGDRTVSYHELVPAGDVSVYNDGIAAGRLLLVGQRGLTLADAGPRDIVIVEHVPDVLPPAAAIITDAPQTPLAHVNLLARNRGIPNASQAGIVIDPGMIRAAAVRAHAVVETIDGELRVSLISRSDYTNWVNSQVTPELRVPPADAGDGAAVIDLTVLAPQVSNETERARWRPVIGGKAVGMMTLLNSPGVNTPPGPLAIAVGAYERHLAAVRPALDEMLDDGEFRTSAQARSLLLDGRESHDERFPSAYHQALADELENRYRGSVLGDVIDEGGFQRWFRAAPMNRGDLEAITEALELHHGGLHAEQGLRFRSSASVEDIEGFTGAGLYDSNTGWLDPTILPDPDDHDRTVERAIKKTWASYWSSEAFEERRLENVDHLSGGMAVLVHPRFDDPLERANGVATLTFLPRTGQSEGGAGAGGDEGAGAGGSSGEPEGSGEGGGSVRAVVDINVQAGAVSVANPDGSSLPEIIRVEIGDGLPRIERLAESTLADGAILSDTDVRQLTRQAELAAMRWRAEANRSLSTDQQMTVVSLDLEFKFMEAGWPRSESSGGAPPPARLVVKQIRSLDPGTRGIPLSVVALPLPRDLLVRASEILRVQCGAELGYEIFTDPTRSPDVGYADTPFTAPADFAPANSCSRSTLHATPDVQLRRLADAGTPLFG